MTVIITKDDSGRRRLLLISSNAYIDREDEIVKQKALEYYVHRAYTGDTYTGGNDLLFWHAGDPIGKISGAAMVGQFLVEVAEEPPDQPINLAPSDEPAYLTTTRQVWDAIEAAPETWGASIGFKHLKGDEQDGAYDLILKFETSVLPLENAANPFTLGHIFGGSHG